MENRRDNYKIPFLAKACYHEVLCYEELQNICPCTQFPLSFYSPSKAKVVMRNQELLEACWYFSEFSLRFFDIN